MHGIRPRFMCAVMGVSLSGAVWAAGPDIPALDFKVVTKQPDTFAPASGCGTGSSGAYEDQNLTMTVGGNTEEADTERTYWLRVPADYDIDIPAPLVFLYHYMVPHNAPWPHIGISGQWADWDGPDPIVVVPQALVLPNPPSINRGWNAHLDWSDMEFIKALKDHVRASYCVDDSLSIDHGESSGGFGAQAAGCYTHTSAVVSDRGGILHPDYAVYDFGFPLTPEPPDELCGPIPALLGSSLEDSAVTWDDIGEPSLEWWMQNNECDGSDAVSYHDEATTQVCNGAGENCVCESYDGCAAELISCTWDNANGHGTSEIQQPDAVWWYNRHAPNDSQPQLHVETFPKASTTHDWKLLSTGQFDIYPLAGKPRLHMVIPQAATQSYVYENYFAQARIDADYWDMPVPFDFSVGVTVTNLKGPSPQARLKLRQSSSSSTVEIRTSFGASGELRARAYLDGDPKGASWEITRSGPGGTRLHDGACWLIRAEPIEDVVRVYSRDQSAWPVCTGTWIERASFDNPFVEGDVYHDYKFFPLFAYLQGMRNTTGAGSSKYIRMTDFYFSRSNVGPGELP